MICSRLLTLDTDNHTNIFDFWGFLWIIAVLAARDFPLDWWGTCSYQFNSLVPSPSSHLSSLAIRTTQSYSYCKLRWRTGNEASSHLLGHVHQPDYATELSLHQPDYPLNLRYTSLTTLLNRRYTSLATLLNRRYTSLTTPLNLRYTSLATPLNLRYITWRELRGSPCRSVLGFRIGSVPFRERDGDLLC